MALTRRYKIKVIFALLVIVLLLAGDIIYTNTLRFNYIEKKIVSAVDQYCEGVGECDIDLAEVFTDFDWDAVSVFIAGDTAQIMDLGVYTEISNGIVFSKKGKPLKTHLSCYKFPEDIPPLISYYLEQVDRYSLHYITLPRERAIVHAEKYLFKERTYKYNIVARCVS